MRSPIGSHRLVPIGLETTSRSMDDETIQADVDATVPALGSSSTRPSERLV